MLFPNYHDQAGYLESSIFQKDTRDVLRDLVPFNQFKKLGKTHRGVLLFRVTSLKLTFFWLFFKS